MAKLAVIFVCAFLMVQFAAAGKIKRDAPAGNPNEAQKTIENALEQMQNFFKTTFTQEQMEKFSTDLKQFGETISAKGKEFIDQANDNLNKLKTQQ